MRSGICWLAVAMLATPAAAGTGPSRDGATVLETDHVRYVIDHRGRNLSFIDKHSGKDYCAWPGERPCITLKKKGVVYEPTECRYQPGKLTLVFGSSGATVVVKIACKPDYFSWQVEKVSDPAVDELTLSNLGATCAKYVGEMSGVAADDEWAVCLRALNLQVRGLVGGRPALLRSVCYRHYGLAGAKIALVGCPSARLRTILKELVRAEGLPYSPLGGPWALDAEENRQSYVFATVSEKNVEQWIELAKKAQIGYLHFVGWERSLGHYQPRGDLFPDGITGLKSVVRQVHAAGLKAGMHTLTGSISPHDPWVTPVPDRRLDVDVRLTLAASLDARDKTVVTCDRPPSLDTVWGYASRGNVVRIDDELIAFSGLSQERPYGLTGCARGALGTKAAPHTKGSAVHHLVVRWNCFQPDEDSTLVDELAEAIARVYNECGFDMIYMDGITEDAMRGGWHAAAKMRAAIFRRLKRRSLVEASCWDYHSWPFHSRIGAWDHPCWGLKQFVDVHCRPWVLDVDGRTSERYVQSSLLPAQLGWWVILGPNGDHRGETPDEMEYFCAKALAYDAPVSFEGVNVGRQPWNARQDEYLAMFARYERLRLAGYFPASVSQRLRQERSDFHLVEARPGTWQLLPADYRKHKVTGRDDGSGRWTVTSRFAAQPARLRIEALWSVEPYDAPGSLVLADFGGPGEFASRAAAPGVSQSLASAGPQAKIAASSGRYQAANAGPSPRGAWTKVAKTLTPEVDLTRHDALGVWIRGDGKRELLNLQLTNPSQYWDAWDEHYVTLDFTGWRYVELPLRERDAEHYADYQWPYGGHYAVYRSALVRRHVNGLNLYFNNLPAHGDVACVLSPIKALRTIKARLSDPAIAIGPRRLVFPVTLESGDYLEFDPDSGCKHYDQRGALLGEVKAEGRPPLLECGENRVQFDCQGPAGLAARAEITLISYGPPLPR